MLTPCEIPDIYLSAEDRLFLETVGKFVDKEIVPARQEIEKDKEHRVVNEILDGLCGLGLFRSMFPSKYGGTGFPSVISSVLSRAEVARGDCGIYVAWSVTGWAFQPALNARNDIVCRAFIPDFCGNKHRNACFAMTEPTGGCDIENVDVLHGSTIKTKAERKGDQWVINGTKRFASNSGVADLYCVVCRVPDVAGDDGIAIIYVPADSKGLTCGEFENKAGMHADRNCDVYFDNVSVPLEYRAGGPGVDAKLLRTNLTTGRLNSAAAALGAARGVLERLLQYTSERIVQGKPIREHSICAGILADMAIGIETAFAYTLQSTYMLTQSKLYGEPSSNSQLARASIAKVYATDVANMVTNRAMELMGSYGYMKEYEVEKTWRDVKEIQLWLGGSQLARLDIVRAYG